MIASISSALFSVLALTFQNSYYYNFFRYNLTYNSPVLVHLCSVGTWLTEFLQCSYTCSPPKNL